MSLKQEIALIYEKKGLNGVNHFVKKHHSIKVSILDFGYYTEGSGKKKGDWLNEDLDNSFRCHYYSEYRTAKNGYKIKYIRGKEFVITE